MADDPSMVRAELEDNELLDERASDIGARFQYSLAGLFSLTTACGVYFLLERLNQGQFGIAMLLGIAIAAGLVTPALFFVVWVLHGLLETREPLRTVLLISVLSSVVFLTLAAIRGL